MIKFWILVFTVTLSFMCLFVLWALGGALVFGKGVEFYSFGVVILGIWVYFVKFFYNLLDTGTKYKKPLFICLGLILLALIFMGINL